MPDFHWHRRSCCLTTQLIYWMSTVWTPTQMQNVNIFIIAHIAHVVVSPISACIAWQRVVSTQNNTFLSILRKQSIDVQWYYTMKHETSGWLYTVDLASRRWMDSKMQLPELCLSFSLNDVTCRYDSLPCDGRAAAAAAGGKMRDVTSWSHIHV